MTLQLPAGARFAKPSKDEALPPECVESFMALIGKISAQRDSWPVLELFKGYFADTMGAAHGWSSSESWADTDLRGYMSDAACNSILFVAAFYEACETLAEKGEYELPDVSVMNGILCEHGVPLEIRPPKLVRVGDSPRVVAPPAPPSLAEQASETIQRSIRRAEELLSDRRPREAVQEMLWILESFATAFRGVALPGGTVEGRYFNEIARELRAGAQGTTLARVVEWCTTLHGYLSSPTGGGVRHGLDLQRGTPISNEEGRLFCNLILSYITFLMAEHERLHS